MTDLTGRHVRIILIGDRFYSGKILEESDTNLKILDKFGHEVLIGKASLISMEVL